VYYARRAESCGYGPPPPRTFGPSLLKKKDSYNINRYSSDYVRSNPLFSLCGLDCCLCPRYHTRAPPVSGCGGPDSRQAPGLPGSSPAPKHAARSTLRVLRLSGRKITRTDEVRFIHHLQTSEEQAAAQDRRVALGELKDPHEYLTPFSRISTTEVQGPLLSRRGTPPPSCTDEIMDRSRRSVQSEPKKKARKTAARCRRGEASG
jgi:hypothetical protein